MALFALSAMADSKETVTVNGSVANKFATTITFDIVSSVSLCFCIVHIIVQNRLILLCFSFLDIRASLTVPSTVPFIRKGIQMPISATEAMRS